MSDVQQFQYLNSAQGKNNTKTYLYNLTPFNPFLYVKLGFIGVYIIFLISAQKHRL